MKPSTGSGRTVWGFALRTLQVQAHNYDKDFDTVTLKCSHNVATFLPQTSKIMTSIALKSMDVRSRVEPELKQNAADVLAQCGLTLSDGIRLFLRQVVAQRGLPFDVKVPSPETQAAMNELRTADRARFKTAQELFDDLDKVSKG